MGKRLKIKAEANAEAERIIAAYPRRELVVVERQVIRDMSVAIVDIKSHVVPYDEIKKGEILIPGLDIMVMDVADDCLVLEWGNTTYDVKLGEKVKADPVSAGTKYLPGNKYLEFEFRHFTLENKMFEILKTISDTHARLTNYKSQFPETTRDEFISLRLIDELIKEGQLGLYPLKALLMASNNWATGEFVRPSLFRLILLEGIDKGCLAPDVAESWQWLDTAALENDPETFMDDMERWYDILATAVEHGNEIARDLMDRIWEPEQIIEED